MRGLAEYVMKGRFQAILAAVFTTGTLFFAWVGAAIIALVILRRGIHQGAYVLFWALLPALLLAAWGDSGPLTTVSGAALIAAVLRLTASWSWALMAAVVSGVLTSVLLVVFGQGYLEQLVTLFNDNLAQMPGQPGSEHQLFALVPGKTLIAGLLGLSNAFTVVVSLILARWWQALLYNPGGFRREFLSLRIAPACTVVLVAVGIMLATSGPDYRFWALIFSVPLVFAGFALIHALAASRGAGNHWLVVFYLCWLVLGPLKLLLLLAAIADSWLDIRSRLPGS